MLEHYCVLAMSVEDVFERWLAETPFWQTDWPMEQFHNFVFRYDEQTQGGHHVVTLVDSGIPNLVAQPLRPPSLGPQTFMTCQPKDSGKKGPTTQPEEPYSKMHFASRVKVIPMQQSSLSQGLPSATATGNCMLASDHGRWHPKLAANP